MNLCSSVPIERLDVVDAAALKNSLDEAFGTYQVAYQTVCGQVSDLRSTISQHEDMEHQCEREIRTHFDSFVEKMSQAQITEGKNAELLRQEAIEHIQQAEIASLAAKHWRTRINAYRKKLDLQNEHQVTTASSLAESMCKVVKKALGRLPSHRLESCSHECREHGKIQCFVRSNEQRGSQS